MADSLRPGALLFQRFVYTGPRKTRAVLVLRGASEWWKRSVGADGCLDFGFVDIEVGVDVLHVVVLFERFD